jgi:hypothetical protein
MLPLILITFAGSLEMVVGGKGDGLVKRAIVSLPYADWQKILVVISVIKAIFCIISKAFE